MFFRCESVEMLFYHTGHPLSVYLLPPGTPGAPSGLQRKVLGPDVARGQVQGWLGALHRNILAQTPLI